MNVTFRRSSLVAALLGSLATAWSTTPACCPAPPSGSYAINADQTVVILWDAAKKTQHFIRQASFKSDAADFGFIIPSPTVPELAEAGNAAFGYLREVTKPAIEYRTRPTAGGCNIGCSDTKSVTSGSGAAAPAPPLSVQVLHTQRVAGFDAVVLSADTTADLTTWLKEHDYAYSREVAAWAEPYVANRWKFTALKVAKGADGKAASNVEADALRMSFVTDAPLFPYREPEYGEFGTQHPRRTLRVFFLGESRYEGRLAGVQSWSGKAVWSDRLTAEQRTAVLEKLQLPAATGPAELRLTEYEDWWRYEVAKADLTFSAAQDQSLLRRPPTIIYTAAAGGSPDAMFYVAAVVVAWPALRLRRRR